MSDDLKGWLALGVVIALVFYGLYLIDKKLPHPEEDEDDQW